MPENEQLQTDVELNDANRQYVLGLNTKNAEAMRIAGDQMQEILQQQATMSTYESQNPFRRRR
jgi:hypothetical protein